MAISRRAFLQGTIAGGWSLTVTTSAAASPIPFTSPAIEISRVGTTVILTCNTVAGKTYVLEYVDRFSKSAWTPLDSVAGIGGEASHRIMGARRHYLLQQLILILQ